MPAVNGPPVSLPMAFVPMLHLAVTRRSMSGGLDMACAASGPGARCAKPRSKKTVRREVLALTACSKAPWTLAPFSQSELTKP